jgi:3,4-dihydroxy 2-butanone 4-phosphate synthase/GTP cyclohydrolase II
MIAYESEVNGGESHLALVKGELCEGCPAVRLGSALANGSTGAVTIGEGELQTIGATRKPCSHAVLVRVHTRCTAGDVFAADCHCRETLDESMRRIAEEGCGAVLYLHNTSRGFEIERTPEPARPFEAGGAVARDTPSGRLVLHEELRKREGSQARTGRILRAIGLGGQILSDLGIQRIRLLSNTPMHIPALEGFGLEIVEQVAIPVAECSNAV